MYGKIREKTIKYRCSDDALKNLGVLKLARKPCPNIEINLEKCPCTYPCDIKGICCQCLLNHRLHGELPACYFPPEVERTYDRSIRRFIALHRK